MASRVVISGRSLGGDDQRSVRWPIAVSLQAGVRRADTGAGSGGEEPNQSTGGCRCGGRRATLGWPARGRPAPSTAEAKRHPFHGAALPPSNGPGPPDRGTWQPCRPRSEPERWPRRRDAPGAGARQTLSGHGTIISGTVTKRYPWARRSRTIDGRASAVEPALLIASRWSSTSAPSWAPSITRL